MHIIVTFGFDGTAASVAGIAEEEGFAETGFAAAARLRRMV